MPDDLRQRYAEALAAKFTYPVYRCDRDGGNEWVENPEPADRVEQTPYVMVSAGDGNRSFWTPSCTELGEVVAAVRDIELETVRRELAEANVTLTELAPAKDRSDEDRLRKERNEWRERAEKAEAELETIRASLSHSDQTKLHLLCVSTTAYAQKISEKRDALAQREQAVNDCRDALTRAEKAEAAIARVRRLCQLTIDASVRVQAIDQARDTLAVLDTPEETGRG